MILTSLLLEQAGFRHGFFTRVGGVSQGLYASLNCAFGTGDQDTDVQHNLARVACALGVPENRLFALSQAHGTAHWVVQPGDTQGAVAALKGDAVLSSFAGLACCVRTADCVPILLADRRSGAACAIHSGWRGAVGNVVAAAVRALRELAGGEVDLIAAVGPHISLQSFEVGQEVAQRLQQVSPVPGVVQTKPFAKPHVDLRRLVEAQLRAVGVGAVEHVEGCTVSQPGLFFSYRRDGARSGRHLSAIVPRREL